MLWWTLPHAEPALQLACTAVALEPTSSKAWLRAAVALDALPACSHAARWAMRLSARHAGGGTGGSTSSSQALCALFQGVLMTGPGGRQGEAQAQAQAQQEAQMLAQLPNSSSSAQAGSAAEDAERGPEQLLKALAACQVVDGAAALRPGMSGDDTVDGSGGAPTWAAAPPATADLSPTDPTAAKEAGNARFRSGQYDQALQLYCSGVQAVQGQAAVLLSNRAACGLQEPWPGAAKGALLDACTALVLSPSLVKAHFRKARALLALGLHELAREACSAGLRVEPSETSLVELAQRIEAGLGAAQAAKGSKGGAGGPSMGAQAAGGSWGSSRGEPTTAAADAHVRPGGSSGSRSGGGASSGSTKAAGAQGQGRKSEGRGPGEVTEREMLRRLEANKLSADQVGEPRAQSSELEPGQ